MKKLWFLLLIPIYALIWYFTSAPLNLFLDEGAWFVIFLVITFLILLFILRHGNPVYIDYSNRQGNLRLGAKKKTFLTYVALAVALPVLLVLIDIFTSPLFASGAYKNQIGSIEERKFETDIQPIDVSQLPIVDKALAIKLADKKLGEKPSLGSMATIGDPVIQRVNGNLVWVLPLQHTGFFKWLANMGGTPGYIVVSATNQNDIKYVENYKIKIQPAAFFNDNLERHTRFSAAIFTGITDYTFEIDETGHPFWVVTTYKNTLGLNLPEATGVILVDAVTGSTQKYSMSNIPDWVDRVQPESFVVNQVNNNGQYIHGVFNFSNKDKYQTSEGNIIVYYNNKCYLLTGLTSVGSDESATGFILVDMVTKKPILYRLSGSTEYAAQQSAEGKVQHLNYTASFPIIINVNNIPTYFMTLKDKEGLIKQFSLVSVKDYNTVGIGETISNALKNYEYLLSNSNSGDVLQNPTTRITLEGTVDRIASELNGQYTVYKLILKENPDKIFTINSDVSDELALTIAGDKVSITYLDTTAKTISVTSFDNLAYTQK